MASGDRLVVTPQQGDRVTTATVTGVLDVATYPVLRDGLLKIAADAPHGLIADIEGLTIADDTLTSVFALVAMRVTDWPGIPFAIVVARQDTRALPAARSVDNFVSVQHDFAAAKAGLARPPRRRVTQLLARSAHVSALARMFVGRICAEWSLAHLANDAQMVVTELVDNAMQHTAADPWLRLELRQGRLTIAVSDDDPRPAVLRERLDALEPGLGLRLVAEIAKVWGCSPAWSGGKVVWAVLPGRTR
ncbi:ATP-binding protein [Amycolatopsis sp. OK19-0408]|uniref:ATP-binding protein n=1 Tax=Amycolatopsis iheyensis TaxID=2945988 RepID=A0A9X2NKV5_9PSEU|nr:ATP-binding protein [Amycolatopsis iheyensis]MCR6490559.1 ATP-binding protein [Amycolatopsis iheyensis]